MTHPLETVINEADGFLLIGESSKDYFPGFSYDAYTRAGKRFFCLDLDGLPASRGPTKGGKVYASVDELPPDCGDLAVIWVPPASAVRAVDEAHAAGCTRIWFSFHTTQRDAVDRAREHGMEVVELGRCPVYYLEDQPRACRFHTRIAKITGTYRRPPQTDPTAKRREVF